MATGIVKWFNVAKGFGFLSPHDAGDEDVFVHFSSITGDGFKKLIRGQKVNFELETGDKGLHATSVVVTDCEHNAELQRTSGYSEDATQEETTFETNAVE